ncbi:MAG: hypothetical protein M3010_10205 [Candidatus Dormibacteraeota bacterium]|nr:hypothetical protein [Candidatus Dormibacteraeota bacterium]
MVFFSTAGGTGRSTLAAEVAGGLAAGCWGDPAPRVALLDLDLRAPSTGIRLGLQGAGAGNLATDDVDGPAMEASLLRHESGARVLLSPSGDASPSGYAMVAARLFDFVDDSGFDLAVIDTASGIDDLNTLVLENADEIFCVFSPTPTGLYDLYRGVATLRRMGHRAKVRCVANRVEGTPDLGEVTGDLRIPLVACIPASGAFRVAEELHQVAVMDSDPARRMLAPLARAVYPDLDTLSPVGHRMDRGAGYFSGTVPARREWTRSRIPGVFSPVDVRA